MRTTSASKAGLREQPAMGERAQVRTLVLALVSFVLGVTATAVWFHFATVRSEENPNPPATDQQNHQPSDQQSAMPSSGVSSPAQPFVQKPVPVSQEAVDDVKRALPNYASLTVDQGTDILRQAALEKYAAAAQELQTQIAQAQAELSLAQSKSPADQQAAMKHLQEVQAEQSQKLQQIGGELQTQIAALKQLKAGQ